MYSVSDATLLDDCFLSDWSLVPTKDTIVLSITVSTKQT